MKHSKKEYPLPGPGAHFLDKQLMKKVKSENAELFVKHANDPTSKKPNFVKEKRLFNFMENPKDAKAFPAPNRYTPHVFFWATNSIET